MCDSVSGLRILCNVFIYFIYSRVSLLRWPETVRQDRKIFATVRPCVHVFQGGASRMIFTSTRPPEFSIGPVAHSCLWVLWFCRGATSFMKRKQKKNKKNKNRFYLLHLFNSFIHSLAGEPGIGNRIPGLQDFQVSMSLDKSFSRRLDKDDF